MAGPIKPERSARSAQPGTGKPHECPICGRRVADKRDGPTIVDEAAGRPYAENRYQQEWRKIADAAGVPRGVFNMDARSGGATEADEAGAARSDLQRGMGHSDPKTTTRYVRGETLPSARRVATARAAHRARSGST